jgi:hypothetical protein
MADIHVKALGNSPEALRRGECYASVDSLSDAGRSAMANLRAKYNVRLGAVYLPSAAATAFAERCHEQGLTVRYN